MRISPFLLCENGEKMRHLPESVRCLFKSDMRIVVDYLAEGAAYRSDRKIVHKISGGKKTATAVT